MKNRRWPRALIALCIATSLLLVACGKVDKPQEARGTKAPGTTTVTDGSGDPVATGDPADPSAPSTGDGSTTKNAGATTKTSIAGAPGAAPASPTTVKKNYTGPPTTLESDLGTPQDPGPLMNPKEGKYSYTAYRGTTKSDLEKSLKPFTVKIDMTSTSGTSSTFAFTNRSDASSVDSVQHYFFRATSVNFDKQVDKGSACDWAPDLLHLLKPMTLGRTWSSSSSCTFAAGPVVVTRELYEADKIVRWGRAKVGGAVVDCYVVERELTLNTSYVANGEKKTSETLVDETEWIAAKTGVVAREVIITVVKAEDGKSYSWFERYLDKLEPEPLA